MDDSSYKNLSSSHLLGSVPAVITDAKEKSASYDDDEVPEANLQIFPPNQAAAAGGATGRGYQTPTEGFEQPANNWKGVFNVSSYTQYFNVDTDIFLNRLLGSLYPIGGEFVSKIDANPDLYGLIWISTTLVFVLAALGNCATYLMEKRTDKATSWSFNVSYMNVAAGSVYGYAAVVPLAFYFLLRYMGSNPSLVRFWCMWGYSLFIFVLASFLLLIPVEFLRWVIIILTGAASSTFIATNLKAYVDGNDLTIVVAAAFFLQLALAIFIKVWFFP